MSCVLAAAMLLGGCTGGFEGEPLVTTGRTNTNNSGGNNTGGNNPGGNNTGEWNHRKDDMPKPVTEQNDSTPYAVKTTLRETFLADPEKGIGVYGRYTELSAGDDAPQTLKRVLADANARAKEYVEAYARDFLEENDWPVAAQGGTVTETYRYRNYSYIVNVTRADDVLFSVLETETVTGIGNEPDTQEEDYRFTSAVYDTQSGEEIPLTDFLAEEGLSERLYEALVAQYRYDPLLPDWNDTMPAWTADYLGLHFYFDADRFDRYVRSKNRDYHGSVMQVSFPYSGLTGTRAAQAAKTPGNFIARLDLNTDYALPYDSRTIRVQRAEDTENADYPYRIVIRDGEYETYWWLEYAEDYRSQFYVFRAQDNYYFYKLEPGGTLCNVYNFARPGGGFDRFANQGAQSFDSFLSTPELAVPYHPGCVHMCERRRELLDDVWYAPHAYYAFLPEQGRGSLWLHFALSDDALAIDSNNRSFRLLHELHAQKLDWNGNETGEILIPQGEILTFLRAKGESQTYFGMAPQSKEPTAYSYDCLLSDGTEVRLDTGAYETVYTDGMYVERIAEPLTRGAAHYEGGLTEVPQRFVEIGGKEYPVIRDLSVNDSWEEEVDFGDEIWWEVENFTGTFTSPDGDAELVIQKDGSVTFVCEGKLFTGKMPEKRYYDAFVEIRMKCDEEPQERTFTVRIEDDLPPHDPSFRNIRLTSHGLPATNKPSGMPWMEADLRRK